MRPSVVVTTAALALSASAFAVAPPAVDLATTTVVDGLSVTVHLDDDPATEQPVVLEVLEDAPDAEHVAARTERVTVVGAAYATLVLPACDPQDRVAAVAAAAAYVTGVGAADDGTTLDGVDGRLVGLGVDWSGHDLLSAASDPVSPVRFDGLATVGAVLDPHEVRHSDGGVPRASLPGQLVTAAVGPSCRTAGDASTAPRTAADEAADLTQRTTALLSTPILLRHDADSPAELSQVVDLWNGLRAVDDVDDADGLRALSVTNAARTEDFPDDEDFFFVTRPGLETLLRAALDEGPVGDVDRAILRRNPVAADSSHSSCDLGGCRGSGSFGAGSFDLLRYVDTHSFFLNRTFEQDLDCVPVCVPGPGTGEIGTLETVNRFETPHAPVFTWADAGVDSERLTEDDPLNDGSGIGGDESLPGGHGYHSLAFTTGPVAEDTFVSLRGRAELDGWFSTGRAGGTVTPILLVRSPNDHTQVVARGALDLDFHEGADQRRHVGGWKRGVIRFEYAHVPLFEGDRLEVILQSGNGEHYAPGQAQGTINVATGPVADVTTTGSVLHLPLDTRFGGSEDGAPFGD